MSTGSVFQRSDGYWCASLQVNGRRKTVYAKTKREARKKLAELQQEYAQAGIVPQSGTNTVNDLLDLWLETIDVKEVTQESYESYIDRYVRPVLGDIRINKLGPEHLQKLYNDMKEDGLTRAPHMTHRLLHTALKHAVLWGWIPYNPADRVIPPKWQADRRPVWSMEELQTFLEETEDYWLHPVWKVILTTGLRLAELSGLKWSDIDYWRKELSVRRVLSRVDGEWVESRPKTDSSERTITLSPEAIAAFKKQKVQQNEWRLKASEWPETDRVFTNKDGEPLSHSTVQHATRRMNKKLGITHLTPHDMRHMHATLLLSEGVPIPVVSARLGHANPTVTMTVYAHALPASDQLAADAISRVM